MTREEKRAEIEHLKNEACTPKSRLMELAYRLDHLEAGNLAKQVIDIYGIIVYNVAIK